MKKLLLLLLLIPSTLYALDCSIEAGWQYKQIVINDEFYSDFGEYFIEIDLLQKIGFIDIYGSYRNEMDSTDT